MEKEGRIVHASFVGFVYFSPFLTQPINLLLCHDSIKAFVTRRVRNRTMASFRLTQFYPHILVLVPQNNAKRKTKLFESTKLNK